MLAHASIIGRHHRLMNQNCQDFAITGSPKSGYGFGIVLDGCGSKYRETAESKGSSGFIIHPSQNEVGARIIGQFLAQWLNEHLVLQEKLNCLPEKMQLAAELFLRNFLMNMAYFDPAEQSLFTRTNLLATILGFAITPTEGCFFWVGDGYLQHEKNITSLDCNNRPPYLAYSILGEIGEKIPRPKMESRLFPMNEELSWLAVATDGWQMEQLALLARPESPLALQRRLNVEAKQRGRFEDDGAIALWMKDVA